MDDSGKYPPMLGNPRDCYSVTKSSTIKQRTPETPIRPVALACIAAIVTLNLRPAPVDAGIVFRRVDLPEVQGGTGSGQRHPPVSSTLVQDNARVATIGHLASALAGLGIDNLYIDIRRAVETPIMDGNAIVHFPAATRPVSSNRMRRKKSSCG